MTSIEDKVIEGVLLKVGDVLLISTHGVVKKFSIAVFVWASSKLRKKG